VKSLIAQIRSRLVELDNQLVIGIRAAIGIPFGNDRLAATGSEEKVGRQLDGMVCMGFGVGQNSDTNCSRTDWAKYWEGYDP
jgi:hypothetical protein